MMGVNFLDNGGGTGAARRRVRDFWARRCPDDVLIIVFPTSAFRMRKHWRDYDAVAFPETRKIILPTSTLRSRRWETILEHEMLHLEHPDWDEAQVEREAHIRTHGTPAAG